MCKFFVSSMCEFATADKFAEKHFLKKKHGGLDGGQKFATAGGDNGQSKHTTPPEPLAQALFGEKTNKKSKQQQKQSKTQQTQTKAINNTSKNKQKQKQTN